MVNRTDRPRKSKRFHFAAPLVFIALSSITMLWLLWSFPIPTLIGCIVLLGCLLRCVHIARVIGSEFSTGTDDLRLSPANVTLPAAGFVSLGLMLACGNALGQDESPGSAGAETAATAIDSAKGSVEVKLTEYKIEMPTLMGPGATTFNVTNTGKETHGFEIEGNGIEKTLKPRLKKGESGSLQVDLKPGSYKVYCPVIGHKWHGMSLDLTVK